MYTLIGFLADWWKDLENVGKKWGKGGVKRECQRKVKSVRWYINVKR